MMSKTKKILLFLSILMGYIALLVTGQYWILNNKHVKPDLKKFASQFKNNKVYFEALGREVDIGPNNYFRDDGAVNDLNNHSRKLRLELSGLMPIEQLSKIAPEPKGFVDGLSFGIKLEGKFFTVIFYKSKGKNQAEIYSEKIHEQTHALIYFGKISLIKNFLKSKNISVEYDKQELYKLCELDPNKKHLLKIFDYTILDKNAAVAEFLALKMQAYHHKKNL